LGRFVAGGGSFFVPFASFLFIGRNSFIALFKDGTTVVHGNHIAIVGSLCEPVEGLGHAGFDIDAVGVATGQHTVGAVGLMVGSELLELVCFLRVEHYAQAFLVAVAQIAIALQTAQGDGLLVVKDSIFELALLTVDVTEGVDGTDVFVVGRFLQPANGSGGVGTTTQSTQIAGTQLKQAGFVSQTHGGVEVGFAEVIIFWASVALQACKSERPVGTCVMGCVGNILI